MTSPDLCSLASDPPTQGSALLMTLPSWDFKGGGECDYRPAADRRVEEPKQRALFSVPEKKNKLNGDLLPVFYRAVSWSEGITAWGAGSSAWDTKTLR